GAMDAWSKRPTTKAGSRRTATEGGPRAATGTVRGRRPGRLTDGAGDQPGGSAGAQGQGDEPGHDPDAEGKPERDQAAVQDVHAGRGDAEHHRGDDPGEREIVLVTGPDE